MYQRWHHLLFLHWPINVEALRSLIPDGLEIDTFDGKAYVGVVLFTMSGIRPRFAPLLPCISSFHEFNVRTYVRQGDRPGVWFFSLDAANKLGATLARSWFKLPYHHARMDMRNSGGRVHYSGERLTGRRPACLKANADISGDTWHAAPGTLAHFLIERYRLFTEWRGELLTLKVRHTPYPLRQVDSVEYDQSLTAALGLEVAGDPVLHYSDGVSTEIFGLEKVR
jgi:uncharacterized protein YqjF (DUF2071 family)